MTIQAIFADGVFRPIEPVDLPEDCKVEFEPRIIDAEIVQDLDAIYAVLAKRFDSGEHDVAQRHNEHQP